MRLASLPGEKIHGGFICSLNRSPYKLIQFHCPGVPGIAAVAVPGWACLCCCVSPGSASAPDTSTALERRMRLGGTRNMHQAAQAQPSPFSLGSACPAALSQLIIPAPNSQSVRAPKGKGGTSPIWMKTTLSPPERWWLSKALQDPCQAPSVPQDQGLLHRQCKESTH